MEAGYDASKALGIDYSPDAVKLARAVARDRGFESVTYAQVDFIADDPPVLRSGHAAAARGSWDLVVDKGTFDAIALGVKDEDGNPPEHTYPSRVAKLLKPGGVFHITCLCCLLPLVMSDLRLSVQFY